MRKFGTLRQPLVGFWTKWSRIKEKKNLPKKVVYLSCSAGRTHFARTNLPPGYQGLAQSRQFATWRSGLKQSRQFALGFGTVYIICHLEIWAWHNLPPGDQILHSLDNLRAQVCHRYILILKRFGWQISLETKLSLEEKMMGRNTSLPSFTYF